MTSDNIQLMAKHRQDYAEAFNAEIDVVDTILLSANIAIKLDLPISSVNAHTDAFTYCQWLGAGKQVIEGEKAVTGALFHISQTKDMD